MSVGRKITAHARAASAPATFRRRVYVSAARHLVFAIVVLLAFALYLTTVGLPR